MNTTTTIGAPVAAPPATRLHYLDNLRVYLTFLVVAHHVAIVYGNIPAWPNWEGPGEPAAGLPLDAFVMVNQLYFMGFFFLLSGHFAPGSIDRRGGRTFALERLRRLGIPFLAFVVLLRPLYTLPTYLGLEDRPPYWRFYFTETNNGPMWFLEVLLAFSLLYAWFRSRRPEAPEPVEPAPLRAWQILVFALALAAVSWVWRMGVPLVGYVPILGLPSAAYMPQYAALFVIGLLAYRRGWFRALPKRAALLGAGFIAGSLVPMALGGYAVLDFENPPPGTDLAHLGFALCDSLFAMGAILLLLGVFQRWFNGSGPLGRFLSANAYAVYLLHAPIIVGVVAVLGPVELAPVLKFALGFAIAAPLSWLAAAAIRKVKAVRAVL
ncbi:acyltransferase family protein [Glycomyces sp. A-F 0318]|uniref:acyltransferase family protein n=1 Tax=Glycomyces amatae TaxID=2881355 RepID=UPI001E2ED3CB|nr:acyltransferase family protein [Glycomyces amatae]MCD0445447.1 acyltransferase family protein [Glycomyces amatae]